MNKNFFVATCAALVCSAVLFGCATAQTNARSKGPLPAVVLVHGAFVDGSGWEGVYKILKRDGYAVSVVQNPTTSLADDVAAARRVIGAQSGPVVLVGHSYGGVVISEAGNDPKVAALVYVAAFVPDKGESLQTLSANAPPGAPPPPFLPPQDGFLTLDPSKFAASFAADVDPEKAAFMAASQLPVALAAISAPVSTPAWRAKPSWYVLTTADQMIPPAAQETMAKRAGATITRAEASHAIAVSKPDVVATVIEQAAASVQGK